MAKKLAQIAQATSPRYLSMVKTPANRTGFKVIRSDEDTDPEDTEGKFKATRSRRMDSKDGMLYIALPTDFTEDQAKEVMVQFGLEEDYEVQMEEGQVHLVRGDMVGVEMPTTVSIRLDNKATAYVSESSFSNTLSLRSDNAIGGAVLSGIEFEGHDEDFVKSFLEEKGISEENIERIDDETFYVPHKHTDALRTDRVNIADGVNARIYRADSNDIPESIQRGVVETAYGNYGYGQLDFYAGLMDAMYTDAAYDAVYRLSDILRDITIYSGLNLSSRIDLMNNALSQYGFYMAELMNSLPRSVVSIMTSDISKTSDKEEIDMAGETKKDDATTDESVEAKRSDDIVADEAKVEETPAVDPTDLKQDDEAQRSDEPEAKSDDATEEPKEDMIKRSDVQDMIDAAVSAAVTAAVASRSDAESAEPEAKDAEAEESTGDTAKREDDAMTKLAASVEALAGKVEELGDTSTVRYDNNNAPAGDGSNNVFKGKLFG